MTRRLPMSDQVGVDNPVDAVDKPPMTDHVCHGFSRQNPGTLRTYPQPAEAICGHVDDDSMEFRKEGPRENPKPGPDCEGSDHGIPPNCPPGSTVVCDNPMQTPTRTRMVLLGDREAPDHQTAATDTQDRRSRLHGTVPIPPGALKGRQEAQDLRPRHPFAWIQAGKTSVFGLKKEEPDVRPRPCWRT